MDPYERLANAIILQAVRDWKHAARRLRRHPECLDARQWKEETERFFRSGWFSMLTKLDGEMLLSRLKKEA